MIKTIAFDLGGVVVTLDQPQAVNRFKEIGLADAEQRLDPYKQTGIFGDRSVEVPYIPKSHRMSSTPGVVLTTFLIPSVSQ